jgi:hypothetical protein
MLEPLDEHRVGAQSSSYNWELLLVTAALYVPEGSVCHAAVTGAAKAAASAASS